MRRATHWAKERGSFGNLQAALATLLLRLGVRVTRTWLRERLVGHPRFPRVEAALDVLDDLNVDARVTRFEAGDLKTLSLPCLARLRGGVVRYVVLFDVSPQQITYIDTRHGLVEAAVEEFVKVWSGEVLLASPRLDAGEWNYEASRRRELAVAAARRLALPGTVAIVALALFSIAGELASFAELSLLFGVKALGLILCAVLAAHYFSPEKGSLRRVCPAGRRLNCEGVLNSRGAKLFDTIPVSDIGVIYFLGGLLAILLGALSLQTNSILRLLAVANCLALPYTIFSLYYQGVRLRRWCWPCVGVQALLWVESLILIPWLTQAARGGITLRAVSLIILAYCLPSIVWMIVRPALIAEREAGIWRRRYSRLRNDPVVVKAMLQEAMPEDMGDFFHEFVIGDVGAQNRLTLVLQLHCGGCGVVYIEAKKMQRALPAQVCLVVRLYCPMLRDAAGETACRVFAHALAGEVEEADRLLSNWFTTLSGGNSLRRGRGMPEAAHVDSARPDLQRGEAQVRAYALWAEQRAFRQMPMIFFNGRKLPPDLDLASLKYMLKYTASLIAERGDSDRRRNRGRRPATVGH